MTAARVVSLLGRARRYAEARRPHAPDVPPVVPRPEEPAAQETVEPAAPGLEPEPEPAGAITAAPNPLVLRGELVPRQTGVFWTSSGTEQVEVRVGAPDGPVLSRTGPGRQREQTGEWVQDGLVLYLQDVSDGGGADGVRTLATVTLRVEHAPTGNGRAGRVEEPS